MKRDPRKAPPYRVIQINPCASGSGVTVESRHRTQAAAEKAARAVRRAIDKHAGYHNLITVAVQRQTGLSGPTAPKWAYVCSF